MSSTPKQEKLNLFNNLSSSKKSFFTPCRQIGLKRRSLTNGTPVNIKCRVLNEKNTDINTPSKTNNETGTNLPKSDLNKKQKINIEDENCSITPSKRYYNLCNSEMNSGSPDNVSLIEFHSGLKCTSTETIGNCKSSLLDKFNNVENLLDDYHSETCTEVDSVDIDTAIKEIQTRIDDKKRQINNLKPTLSNTAQHDLNNLIKLTNIWRQGCQEALYELLQSYNDRGQTCTMTSLLVGLGIPKELIRYNEDDCDFY